MLVLGAPTLHTGTYAEITRVATQMHHAYTQMGKGGKKKKEDGERILREKKKKRVKDLNSQALLGSCGAPPARQTWWASCGGLSSSKT